MVFPLGLKKLSEAQCPGEQKSQPEQARSHCGDFVRRKIKGKIKNEQQ